MSLDSLRVHVLQVLVLSRKGDRYPVALVQALSKLSHEGNQILCVTGGITATALGAWPLPVDVDTTELPFGEKLPKRLNELVPVLFGAGHLGPCPPSGSRVAELPTANAKVFGDAVWSCHEVEIHSLLIGVHLADPVRQRIDGGEGKDEVREACGIEILWQLLIARCAARVPTCVSY